MASVYQARDGKHDRLVALKVLRPELAGTVVRSVYQVSIGRPGFTYNVSVSLRTRSVLDGSTTSPL